VACLYTTTPKKATRYGIGEAYSSVIGLLKSIDYSVVWLRRRRPNFPKRQSCIVQTVHM